MDDVYEIYSTKTRSVCALLLLLAAVVDVNFHVVQSNFNFKSISLSHSLTRFFLVHHRRLLFFHIHFSLFSKNKTYFYLIARLNMRHFSRSIYIYVCAIILGQSTMLNIIFMMLHIHKLAEYYFAFSSSPRK